MSKRDPLSLPASVPARWRRGLTLRSFTRPAPPSAALTREARVITQNNTPCTDTAAGRPERAEKKETP